MELRQPNRFVLQSLNQLSFDCQYENCDKSLKYKEALAHLQSCSEAMILCT